MVQKSLASILLTFLFSMVSSAQFLPSNDENILKMNGQDKQAKQRKKKKV